MREDVLELNDLRVCVYICVKLVSFYMYLCSDCIQNTNILLGKKSFPSLIQKIPTWHPQNTVQSTFWAIVLSKDLLKYHLMHIMSKNRIGSILDLCHSTFILIESLRLCSDKAYKAFNSDLYTQSLVHIWCNKAMGQSTCTLCVVYISIL